ncbi:MAG: hypothetical protein LPK07_01975 [Hymenobacteraceae bacterium]|nr:hypothetical protein [Hymenobacteraceae bacterium]MDX5480430.1 hypothetical protein [Hymenobacteraceae bacterium]
MKKRSFTYYLIAFLFLLLSTAATAQEQDSLEVQRLRQNQFSGAASVEALATLLHNALQHTNFEPLYKHVVDKQVYDKMLQLSTVPVRETLIIYTPDQILQDFQRNFNKVIRDGITLEVSWPETGLQSIKADTSSHLNAVIIPVQLTLTSPVNPPFKVIFNAARLDNQFFYLPPLQLVSPDLAPDEYR